MNIRRKIAALRFTLLRGYTWCQTPTLALIGAGVVAPYVQQYINIGMFELSLIAFLIFLGVGILDKKLRLLQEEQSYQTENNPTIMKGLFKEARE